MYGSIVFEVTRPLPCHRLRVRTMELGAKRAVAKALVGSGLRCACHFFHAWECPLGAASRDPSAKGASKPSKPSKVKGRSGGGAGGGAGGGGAEGRKASKASNVEDEGFEGFEG